MRAFLSLLTLAVVTATGCDRSLRTDTASTTVRADRRDANLVRVLEGMEANAVDTRYLDARAKVDLDSKKLSIGGTAQIRMEKDKAIWMVVKKFGFEGARALIRPDSFFLINRLEGEYIAESLSYIERKYKIPARFDLLQDIILGNAVFFTDDLRLRTESSAFVLSGRDGQFDTRYTVDPTTYQVSRMELTELAQNRTLTVQNSDFEAKEGLQRPFPTERYVEIRGVDEDNSASIRMEFDRMSFEGPVAMPFARR